MARLHMAQRVVLIVANHPMVREVFHDMFLDAGYECLLAADGREGVEMFRGWRPPLVITDLNLPVMSGIEVLWQVRQEDPTAAVIVVHGSVVKRDEKVVAPLDAEKTRLASLSLGAHAFLEKPVNPKTLLLIAERAIEQRELRLGPARPPQVADRRGVEDVPASMPLAQGVADAPK